MKDCKGKCSRRATVLSFGCVLILILKDVPSWDEQWLWRFFGGFFQGHAVQASLEGLQVAVGELAACGDVVGGVGLAPQ